MKYILPLSGAQLAELDFDPPEDECLGGRAAKTAINLKNCVVYVRERAGRHYWFYAERSAGGTLYGYRRSGAVWKKHRLPAARIKGYY